MAAANQPRRYTHVYRVGKQINDVQADCTVIFESFSLLSWMSAEYCCRIITIRTSP